LPWRKRKAREIGEEKKKGKRKRDPIRCLIIKEMALHKGGMDLSQENKGGKKERRKKVNPHHSGIHLSSPGSRKKKKTRSRPDAVQPEKKKKRKKGRKKLRGPHVSYDHQPTSGAPQEKSKASPQKRKEKKKKKLECIQSFQCHGNSAPIATGKR